LFVINEPRALELRAGRTAILAVGSGRKQKLRRQGKPPPTLMSEQHTVLPRHNCKWQREQTSNSSAKVELPAVLLSAVART